jgi:hypothetical protein
MVVRAKASFSYFTSTSEGSCVHDLPIPVLQAEALNAGFDIDENISLNEWFP